MSARVIARGTWLRSPNGTGEGASSGQLPSRSGSSGSSQPRWVEPLGPAWPSCSAIFARRVGVHEVDDARPGRLVLVLVHPRAAGRDAPVRRDAGHLGEHQPRAALRARAEVDEVEVVRRAVAARVHRHRRDDDAVGQLQLAQPQRREHRRHGRRRAGPLGEPGLDPLDVGAVAQAQVVVAEPLAAGQQAVGELLGLEAGVAGDVLEPLGAVARGVLQPQHLDPRARLVLREARSRSGLRSSARTRPIASSSASLVPEPIEKCAVCAASPSSTRLPSNQRALPTRTNVTQGFAQVRRRCSSAAWPPR